MTAAVVHAFTVDVEEYFQVSALEPYVPAGDWDRIPSRVEASMHKLLDILGSAGTRGTFFTLGWVAERHPAMMRRLVAEGHEIASHGYWHRRVTTQTHPEFRDDVRRAKAILEDTAGVAVVGYRAPTFSIVAETEWALEILAEEGYRYDSSRFPIRRRGYGSPHVPLAAHVTETSAGPLLEVPMTVVRAGGWGLPVAGGGWFRQFPYALTELALRQRARAGVPAVFYIHPWELDPDQPHLRVNLRTRLRHYRGLSHTASRLRRMTSRHRFGPIREVFRDLCPQAPRSLPTA